MTNRLKFFYSLSRIEKKSAQTLRPANEQWSGDLTKNQGFRVEETRIDVRIGEDTTQNAPARKERPVWMEHSTIINQDTLDNKVCL